MDLLQLNLIFPLHLPFFPLSNQEGSEVNSEAKNNESSKEMADQEVVAVQADESTSPAENLPLAEGGKKDPRVRRQELLVSSGLAEVCGFVWTSKLAIVFEGFLVLFGCFASIMSSV